MFLLPNYAYNQGMDTSTKKKNFKRIAEARTQKVLDMIELIGNLSNTSFYEYTDEEIEMIFNEIQKALRDNKEKFKNNGKTKRRFTL